MDARRMPGAGKTDWAGVYEATYPDLVRYLDRKLGDPERARELAQEAFVRGLNQDPAPGDPRGWIFTVGINLVRDELRKGARRRQHLTLMRSESDGADPGPGPLDALEARDRAALAREALATLSERDREALLLRNAGFGYAEIASRTGLAPGAVGTTLSRARQRLAAAFRSSEGTDVARG